MANKYIPPDNRFDCPKCKTRYKRVPESPRVPFYMSCEKCGHMWMALKKGRRDDLKGMAAKDKRLKDELYK